jgi:hypothetical protein
MPLRSLVKDLQRIAAVKLHNTRGVPKNLKDKMELIELAFGHAAVLADFTVWCEENAERKPQYPVGDYIRRIDARLGGTPSVDPHDASIGALQAVVYEKTGILPRSHAVRDLLVLHSVADIEAAFAEYMLVADEKDYKGAIRAFFDDQGASAVIAARRRGAEKQ